MSQPLSVSIAALSTKSTGAFSKDIDVVAQMKSMATKSAASSTVAPPKPPPVSISFDILTIDYPYVGLVVERVISTHGGTDEANIQQAVRSGASTGSTADSVGVVTVVVDKSTGLITDIRDGLFERDDIKLLYFPGRNCESSVVFFTAMLSFYSAGCSLLPGFIDCHVHLSIQTDDYQIDHLRLSSADKSLRCLRAAQGLLHAGFTTIRSAGDADAYFPSFAVAKSAAKGEFLGPTICGAGHYISVTGGGGDINFLSPDNCSCCQVDGVIADGRDAMVAAVRKEIKYGSDWIKVLATGAFMTSSTHAKDSPENTHFAREELVAVVEGRIVCLLVPSSSH
jgi:hypothetical protein